MSTPLPAPLAAASWSRLAEGWRGPLLAALLTLASALPGLFALPPLDRDESRFAQATTQMLESGDYVDIRYQDAPRDKKPVGIHWLQAAAVKLTAKVEARPIWAFRLPSLLGAMTAAAACAWGAAAMLSPRRALLAGSVLGATLILSSEAFIAKTDAVLCGCVTLSMAALGRVYFASRGRGEAGFWTLLAFWVGQGLGILDKGLAPLMPALAILFLFGVDKEVRWARRLGWSWGLFLVALIVLPWAMAITISTDGRFWTGAVAGDLAPKLKGGHESHGAPPGLHALLAPVLFFPASALLAGALALIWRPTAPDGPVGWRLWRRFRLSDDPLVRFAAAWLVPAWIVFELAPTKLAHYTLPLYGALAWLAAAGWARLSAQPSQTRLRWIGAGLSLFGGGLLTLLPLWAAKTYGTAALTPLAALAAVLAAGTALAGAYAVLEAGRSALRHQRAEIALGLMLAGGVALHMLLAGALAPRLAPLWTSQRAAEMIARDHLDPRNGEVQGPVAVAGYAEPSLVFALGTHTELGGASAAAEAIADERPALVEAKLDAAFKQELAARKLEAEPVDHLDGYDYSSGKKVSLTLWRAVDSESESQPAQGEAK